MTRDEANAHGVSEGAADGCGSCGEEMSRNECPKSQRPCGHHCNHSLTHDGCDWCGVEFGEGGTEVWPDARTVAVLSEEPNPDARRPTGMCGSPKKCEHCPSDFLCSSKARAERDLIATTQNGATR